MWAVLDGFMQWSSRDDSSNGREILSPVYELHMGLLWKEQYWPVTKLSLKLLHCPNPQIYGSYLVKWPNHTTVQHWLTFKYTWWLYFLEANCDTEHYLLVAKVRETVLGSSSTKVWYGKQNEVELTEQKRWSSHYNVP